MSYFSSLDNHLVFTHREDKGISLNVYRMKTTAADRKSKDSGGGTDRLELTRLWRSMQYIENSSIRGANLPCTQV